MPPPESPRRKPRERRHHHHHHHRRPSEGGSPRKSRGHATSSDSSTQALSAGALAKLNYLNQQSPREPEVTPKKSRQRRERELEETPTKSRQKRERELEATPTKSRQKRERVVSDERYVVERSRKHEKRKKRRVVSGALLEEAEGEKLRGLRGGDYHYYEKQYETDSFFKRNKKLVIILGILALLLAIIIPVAIVVSKKHSSSSSSSSSDGGGGSSSSLSGMSESDIPEAARGTYLDPFTWFDTTDFNVTYTNFTVGALPIMGLNSTWDNSKQANSNTPPISKSWGSYADTPVRGVNLGGWLSLEPFITPSLFNYDSKLGIIDEWTLTSYLGASGAKSTLEKHYATFVTEQTFIDIANAGLDHVRIPFSYWAVATYDDDPYVFRTSWRYLLRGIEWARKHGLRVNLDVHGLPGSQNGWNHSGRQGVIGWLNGTDGSLNAQRSLDIHTQLAEFFAQDRYKELVAFYGLVNEPKMISLDTDSVIAWTEQAYQIVRKAGVTANIVFGDGFLGLANWQGKLQGYEGLVLDAHQYVIFNEAQVVYNHTQKTEYACQGWTQQTEQSMNTATGFGPTIVAEWSQADTDCATNLNNVGWGTRWEGTYDSGDPTTEVTSPDCPTQNSQCSCTNANADPSQYSTTYKQFLQTFAEAQMASFETGWGWFYWTWVTEDATQWSYQLGLAAGILPAKAYAPDFNCTASIPDYSGLPEYY